MPRKKTLLDPVKVTLRLHASDYHRMAELYPSSGAQAAIRALVHDHVRRSDAKLREETESLIKEIDLGEIQ